MALSWNLLKLFFSTFIFIRTINLTWLVCFGSYNCILGCCTLSHTIINVFIQFICCKKSKFITLPKNVKKVLLDDISEFLGDYPTWWLLISFPGWVYVFLIPENYLEVTRLDSLWEIHLCCQEYSSILTNWLTALYYENN